MKWIKLFIYSAGAVLLAAALQRFLIAAGSAQALTLPEPILGIPIQRSVIIVGVLELACAFFCLFGKRTGLQAAALALLATAFVAYRICVAAKHFHLETSCLGTLTDPLQLARGVTGSISRAMPYFLLVGGYAVGSWLLLKSMMPQPVGAVKMFCPSCGGKISFAEKNLGQKIPCPLCKKPLVLRAPENLKMSCFFCHEHIEFPVHALGQKIPCPHCNMAVILQEPPQNPA